MAAGAAGKPGSSSLWSYSQCSHHEGPKAAVLQSVCTHAPLRSIALAPKVAPQQPGQHQQHQQLAPAPAPEEEHNAQDQQQQQLLELLMRAPDAVRPHDTPQNSGVMPQQQQQKQQQRHSPEQQQPPLLVQQLIAAGASRLPVPPAQLQHWLTQLLPLLPALPPGQLAHSVHAVSVLRSGPAAAAAVPGWLDGVLRAAAVHFKAGHMDMWASSVLLQALVQLGVRPGAAWLQAACAGMPVGRWRNSRALSTVAACLPQLGHVPDSSWAGSFFAATSKVLQDMPAVSLARMLHGVVAWRQLEQQQQQRQHMQDQLRLPDAWLHSVLQQLHSCSSELKPCEVSMTLQACVRLQQPGFWPSSSTSNSSSEQVQVQQASSLLQQSAQQLLHALVPAVARLRHQFGPQDFAVALHSLALLQQQQQQQEGQRTPAGALLCDQDSTCSVQWLQQVLPAVQACLQEANPRTQATLLWSVAALMQPCLRQQAQQQQLQQQQLQHQALQRQQLAQPKGHDAAASAAAPAGAAATATAAAEGQPYKRSGVPLTRPVWQGAKQQALLQELQHLQQQQQQQHTSTAQVVQSTSGGAVVGAQLPHSVTAPQPTPPTASDASGMWMSWLDSFYAASLPLLPAYTPQDLVVTACTLVTQQQVPPVPWYGQLLAAIAGKGGALSPGHVAGLAWALGRLALLPCRHNPDVSLVPLQPWLAGLYAHSGLAVAAAAALAPRKPPPPAAAAAADAEGLAAAAAAAAGWGSAVGGVLQPGLSVNSGAVRAAEDAVRLMWAAAVCDFDPGDAWWGAAEQLLLSPAGGVSWQQGSVICSTSLGPMQPQQQQQRQLQQQCLVSSLPTRLLGALLQAYVTSGRPAPEGMLAAVLSPDVIQQLCSAPLIDTLRVLRGLAQVSSSNTGGSSTGGSSSGSGCCSQHALQHGLQQLAVGMQGRLALVTPRELGQLLVCLADAGLSLLQQQQHHSANHSTESPGSSSSTSSAMDSWTAAVAHACNMRLPQMLPTDISRLLLGSVKLQLQLPPATTQGLLQQMQAEFLDASPVALATAVDAISRMGVLPSRDWLGSFFMATHRSFTAAASAAASSSSSTRPRLVLAAAILQTLQGLARLKAAPPAKWLKQQLMLLHGQLPLLQPRHIATLLLLLARLKCRPSPAYLQKMLQHLADCSTCSELDLVHIAYGMASLRWQPNRQWMQVFMSATASKLHLMSHQGLALVHWALAVIRVTPPPAWRSSAMYAVAARLSQLDALQLSMIVWAWGRLQVHLVPLQSPALGPAAKGQGQQQLLQHVQQRQHMEQQHEQQQQEGEASTLQGAPAPASDPLLSLRDAPLRDSRCRGAGAGPNWQLRGQLAQQLLAAVLALQGQYNASQLAHVLAGIAKLRLNPGQEWLHAMVTKGSWQPLSVLDGYQLQQLLWALALLRFRAAPAWVEGMGVLLETRWQRTSSTRHSAAWALQELQQLSVDGPA